MINMILIKTMRKRDGSTSFSDLLAKCKKTLRRFIYKVEKITVAF